ncbi:MAG: hypothetical protein H7068_07345, partial [Pedobacter sp.]|nr:hypothetical protein [Chitinophagaceae bacterium]
MKKSFFLIMFLCAAIMGTGQTITIIASDFDVSKPYGQGSSISLPITTSGCFNVGNKF